MSEPFIAEIRIFAGNFAPRSWAFCNGQSLPISQNTALFALLGTVYGGDGRTTFNLPNLQGRAPMHPGRGPGLTPRQLGERLGAETVTLTEAQLPAHSHGMNASSISIEDGSGNPARNLTGSDEEGEAMTYHAPTNLQPFAEGAIESIGGGQPHLNMQPYLAINFIIALQGLFPSRS